MILQYLDPWNESFEFTVRGSGSRVVDAWIIPFSRIVQGPRKDIHITYVYTYT